mgnify:CR=1 FL=1
MFIATIVLLFCANFFVVSALKTAVLLFSSVSGSLAIISRFSVPSSIFTVLQKLPLALSKKVQLSIPSEISFHKNSGLSAGELAANEVRKISDLSLSSKSFVSVVETTTQFENKIVMHKDKKSFKENLEAFF